MKEKSYTHIQTVEADSFALLGLEVIGKRVRLSPSCVCQTHGVVGVPSGALDVIIDDRLVNLGGQVMAPSGMKLLVSRGTKVGCYNGRERVRITVRAIIPKRGEAHDRGALLIEEQSLAVSLYMHVGEDLAWMQSFAKIASSYDPENPGRILLWHFARYFPSDTDVSQDVFALAHGPAELWVTDH